MLSLLGYLACWLWEKTAEWLHWRGVRRRWRDTTEQLPVWDEREVGR